MSNPSLYVSAPGTVANNAARETYNAAVTGSPNPALYVSAPGTVANNAARETYDALHQSGSNGVLGARTGGGSYGGGGGGGANAADLAYLNDQEGLLRSFLDRSGQTLNDGLTQIGDSYNKETSRANQSQSQALADIGVKRQDTQAGKLTALNTADTHARSLANSVRQLIGAASGSGSSAYQIAAPKAVNDVASQDRTDIQTTFGRNFRDLATTESKQKTAFDNLLQDLAEQKSQKESGLRNGILTQQQDTLGSLADIARQRAAAAGGGYGAISAASSPYQQQIAQKQSAIDGLFNQYRTPYNVKAVDTTIPQLADYVTSDAGVGQQAAAPGETTSPLLKKYLDQYAT